MRVVLLARSFVWCQRAIGGEDEMPRYMVQRAFPEGLRIAVANGGAGVCRAVIARIAEEGVRWVRSYVSADKRSMFWVYDAPTPGSVRRTAARSGLPVDRVIGVRVLDPYFYS
jgi:hypothetical protein